jgi:hypothetical protein
LPLRKYLVLVLPSWSFYFLHWILVCVYTLRKIMEVVYYWSVLPSFQIIECFFNFSICNAFTMYVDIAYVYMHSKSYIISKKLINVLQFRTKGVYPTYDTRSNTVVLNTSNNLCYPLFVKKTCYPFVEKQPCCLCVLMCFI